MLYPGADPGILVGGGVDFFFKGRGLVAALRFLVAPGQRPDGNEGGKALWSSWILVNLGVKFSLLRWSYTLIWKKKI